MKEVRRLDTEGAKTFQEMRWSEAQDKGREKVGGSREQKCRAGVRVSIRTIIRRQDGVQAETVIKGKDRKMGRYKWR